MLTEQAAALSVVEELLDGQEWRADRRARWDTVLRGLVYGMDWTSGLVSGVTRAQLAAAAGCSVRTVSAVLAWAQEAGLLVLVECGAAAEFLGTEANRAPSYVFTVPPGHRVVERSCNLPMSYVSSKPLAGGIRRENASTEQRWPSWQVPASPSERSAATAALLARTGLGAGRVPLWRVRALLHGWWTSGACVAGLLHMLEHHPDTGARRGDLTHSANDPVRVLGARLRPWSWRLGELPAHLTGRYGDYRRAQAHRLAASIAAAEQRDRASVHPVSVRRRGAAHAAGPPAAR